MNEDINQLPWDEWWAELLKIANAAGKRPGTPEAWKADNWANNQTPQEAYAAEYDMGNWW